MADIPGNITSTATFEGDPDFMTFSGQFETPGDTDWIRVTLRAGHTYEFYGNVQGAGGGGNAFMVLHDAGGNIVALNDDDTTGTATFNSFIPYTAPADGVFYVEIRDQFSQPGDYGLAITPGGTGHLRLTPGDDVYDPSGPPLIVGDQGNDFIVADNHAMGEQGNDTIRTIWFGPTFLSGGLGNDTIEGYTGPDRLFGDAGQDFILGREGDDFIYGGDGVDTLDGGAGQDTLTGGTGVDIMFGGADADKYRVDNAGDSVSEAAGGGSSDRVYASVSYQLAAGAEVEILNTSSNGGTAAINLVGNNFAQTIVGNAGANIINGLGGIDAMHGLGGNDRYCVDNAADVIVEAAGGGTDGVLTSVDYSLKSGVEVEILSTTNAAGTAALKLAGNSFANTVIGNAGNNFLNGAARADTLRGLGGNDIFMFNTAIGGGNVDTITDFNVANDTIRLENAIFTAIAGTGMLTAAQFVKNTSGTALDASDRIIYETDTGRLIYDANGNAGGGRYLVATLDAGLAMTNADFYIV
jgi:Ca2+-binding RTX toxin-like protein